MGKMTIEVMKKSSLAQKFVFVFLLLIVIEPACNHLAQKQDTSNPADLFDMSITELMEIEVESSEKLPGSDCKMFLPPVITTAQNQIKNGASRSLNELVNYRDSLPAITAGTLEYSIG